MGSLAHEVWQEGGHLIRPPLMLAVVQWEAHAACAILRKVDNHLKQEASNLLRQVKKTPNRTHRQQCCMQRLVDAWRWLGLQALWLRTVEQAKKTTSHQLEGWRVAEPFRYQAPSRRQKFQTSHPPREEEAAEENERSEYDHIHPELEAGRDRRRQRHQHGGLLPTAGAPSLLAANSLTTSL